MVLSMSEMIALLRDAILNRRQLVFTVKKQQREFCPHVLGTRQGIWHVYGWQFGGESNEGELPDWRCFELRNITSDIEARAGEWHRGWRARRAKQACVDFIYAEVDPEYGPRPRSTSPLRIPVPVLAPGGPRKR